MGCFSIENAIEIVHHKKWLSLCIESDSTSEVQVFTTFTIVLWRLLNRWLKCMALHLQKG